MTDTLDDRVVVRCAECDTEITVKQRFAGRKMACPLCQTPVTIPADAPPAPAVVGETAESNGNGHSHGHAEAFLPRPVESRSPVPAPPTPPVMLDRLRAVCSHCGTSLAVKRKYSGKFVPCYQCHEPVRVPKLGEFPEEVARRYAVRKDRIKCHCAGCDLLLVVKTSYAGQMLSCPRCRAVVQVPGAPASEMPQDSGAFLVGRIGAAEDDGPFDLQAMMELANDLQRDDGGPLFSASAAAGVEYSFGPSDTGLGHDTDFEMRMVPQRAQPAPPPSPAPPPAPGRYPSAQVIQPAPGFPGGAGYAPPATPFGPAPGFYSPAAPGIGLPLPGSSPGFSLPAVQPWAPPPPAPPAPAPSWSSPSFVAPAPQPVAFPTQPVAPKVSPTPAPARSVPPEVDRSESEASSDEPKPEAAEGEPASSSAQSSLVADPNSVICACAKCGRQVKANRRLIGQCLKCPQCAAPVEIEDDASSSTASGDSRARRLPRSGVSIDREIAAACELPQPAAAEQRMLAPTLGKGALKKIAKRLAAVAQPMAPKKAIDAGQTALADLLIARDSRGVELVAPVLADLPFFLQTQAIKGLGDLGDYAAFPWLVKLLVHRDENVLRTAVTALGALQDRRAVRPLLAFALHRPEERLRGIEAVVKIGPNGVPPLLEVLESSADQSLQHAALEALGKLKNPKTIPAIARFLQHDSLLMRSQAAEMLAQFDDGKAAGALAKALGDDEEQMRMHALAGIIRTPDPRFADALARLLKDPSEEVRIKAIEALGACGNKKSIDRLRPFLSHADDDYVVAAAEALGRLGDDEAISLLIGRLEALGDNPQDQPTVLRLIESLKRVGDPRAVLPLLNLLGHTSHRVRMRVAEALGKLKDPSARPALEDLLRNDAMDDAKASAARALGDLGCPESVRTLIDYGFGQVPMVRCQTVIALGRIKDPGALPAIKDALSDSSPQVRVQTVMVLAEQKSPEAVAWIEPLAADADENVARAALKGLRDLGDQRSEWELQKAARRKGGPAPAGSKPGAPKRRGFSPLDLVPSSLAGVFSPRSWIPDLDTVRNLNLDALDAIPGGKKTLAALVLLVAGGVYLFVQSLGGVVTHVEGPRRGFVQSLAATSDGRLIAAGRTSGMIELWNVAGGSVASHVLDAPTQWIACSHDGRRLIAASPHGVMLLDLSASGKAGARTGLPGHNARITAFAVSQDHKSAVTVDQAGTAFRWNFDAGQGDAQVPLRAPGPITAVALGSDGSRLAAAVEKGPVQLWEVATGALVAEFRGAGEHVTALAISPDGSQLIASSRGSAGALFVWDVASPRGAPARLEGAKAPAFYMEFRPDGKLLATGGGGVDVWDLAAKQVVSVAVSQAFGAFASVGTDGFAVGDNESAPILVYSGSGKLEHQFNVVPRGI